MKAPLSRLLRVGSVTVALTLAVYAVGLAHAVVFPRASTVGARERYVLRVPNEKAVPTTRVEIQFPSDVSVSSFIEVPGWNLEVVRDSAKRIIGAVWTGTLAPERTVEFPFAATNPKAGTEIRWPVFQTYGDGERVEWTGPSGSPKPASVTTLAAAVVATTAAAAAPAGASPMIAYAALAISVISLGLALRKPKA
ncbi:MAG TPA: DUF1775 domain-containing protein [Gemmatimonadaceae bacterium]